VQNWFRPDANKPSGIENMVLRDGRLQADPNPGRGSQELAAAQELYRQDKFADAEKAFHKVAENTKNSPLVGEEARFYEAECLYKTDQYPKACDTYHKMLVDFPAGAFRDQAVRRMFDIANVWLEDTRQEMAEYREKKEGSRTFVMPASLVMHPTEKKKPLVDEEGRALQALEWVHLNDITGPLADKALFLAGGVKFYREDYNESAHYLTQLVEQHKDSPLAPQAIELAIISKAMSTGGPDYDGRKVVEARALVDTAVRNYPELAREKSDFLERQLAGISFQQAQKDYQTAEFYRRTKHPGSAYFYYEIVRRRYPGTKFADLATQRMEEIRRQVEENGNRPPNIFDNMRSSWDGMWGKKRDATPLPDGSEPTPPPPTTPVPMPAAVPRSLPSDLMPRG
jgi:outer membrane protein assembly factor BamD (BamD/ComL family)